MTLYLPILFESAWVASIIPFSSEPTFFAMKAFGGFNMPLATALAILGASGGMALNWAIGRFLIRFKNSGIFKISDDDYAYGAHMFNRYGIVLLLISWMPLCNLLAVIAGFLGTKPKVALALLMVGEMFNYGRYLL